MDNRNIKIAIPIKLNKKLSNIKTSISNHYPIILQMNFLA